MSRVTVLCGAFNNASTLPRAIESILNQTVTDLELIVIDDGSTDATAEVLAGYLDPRVRMLTMGRNIGIARSLNAGLLSAASPIVSIQDADDWSEPCRLERQLALLDVRPDVAVVGSRMREVGPDGRELRPRTSFAAGDVRRALLRFNPIPNTSAAFRREAVLGVGGYDPRFRYATEYDLWLRLVHAGHGAWTLDEVLSTRTMSGVNVAARAEREQIQEVLKLRLSALRRSHSLRGVGGIVPYAVSYVTPFSLKRAFRLRLGQAP